MSRNGTQTALALTLNTLFDGRIVAHETAVAVVAEVHAIGIGIIQCCKADTGDGAETVAIAAHDAFVLVGSVANSTRMQQETR